MQLIDLVCIQCTLHEEAQHQLSVPFVRFSESLKSMQLLVNEIYTPHLFVICKNASWFLNGIAVFVLLGSIFQDGWVSYGLHTNYFGFIASFVLLSSIFHRQQVFGLTFEERSSALFKPFSYQFT